jgi:uncharacterized protein (DUF885 family)
MRYSWFVVFLGVAMASCSVKAKKVYTQDEILEESERITVFLDSVFDAYVHRSPEYQSYLGIKTDYDKWDDISDENDVEELRIAEKALQEMKMQFNPDKLNHQASLSYRLYEYNVSRQKEGFRYRFHNYPVNQLFGMHSSIPSFLINIHRIDSLSDARAYVSRLIGVSSLFDQLIVNIEARAQKGIIPPKFVFPQVIDDCKKIIGGLGNGKIDGNNIYADFSKKVDALQISKNEKEQMKGAAAEALRSHVKPAYEKLIAYLSELEKKSTADDGVWKFPYGDEFYRFALERNTTTDLSAEEIFQTGLSEVERIKFEMVAIMQSVGFGGDLKDFYEHLKTSPEFYYPNTDAGREQYLQKAVFVIDSMKSRLPELFITLPKADIVVKAVEPYREKSTAAAFYQSPAPDGSRPGTFYVNLYDMNNRPIYELEALAYHEGIPGHHMQISIAQELKGIPKFRTQGNYTAYAEGWGLYSELLPREIGFYADHYSDFGRLSMEMWRACRLVVDVGLHYKKWTRQQAIEYMCANTPKTTEECRKEIERYIVLPAQATAYKTGMLKILELRLKAQNSLGASFDLKEFHDVILTDGALPLNFLEENVDAWIGKKKEIAQ